MASWGALSKQFPDNLEYRERIAEAHGRVAAAARQNKNPAKAVQESEIAQRIYAELIRERGGIEKLRVELAKELINYGNYLWVADRKSEVVGVYGRVLSELESLTPGLKNSPEVRDRFRTAHILIARFKAEEHDFREAIRELDAAMPFSIGSERLSVDAEKALFSAKAGDLRVALALADRLSADKELPADGHFFLARLYGWVAQKAGTPDATQYESKGLDYLRQAVRKGYEDLDEVERQVDLASLRRQRADFEEILQILRARREKQGH